MKKKTLIMVLTGCMMLSPVSAYAADATETTTEDEVTEAAAQEDSADSESTGELGDDIYSFSMEFDGQTMKFPMTYQEFTDMGWELSSREDPDTKSDTGEMVVFVDELADSAVIMGLRVWVATDKYWPAKWRLNELIKESFDANGIEIPYNQLQIHVKKQKTEA